LAIVAQAVALGFTEWDPSSNTVHTVRLGIGGGVVVGDGRGQGCIAWLVGGEGAPLARWWCTVNGFICIIIITERVATPMMYTLSSFRIESGITIPVTWFRPVVGWW
jgi:hypothetical protein